MLILLEFSARIALCDPQLLEFTEQLQSRKILTLQSLEVMAAVAIAHRAKQIASVILRRLVGDAMNLPKEQRSAVPVYLRENILLFDQVNESFEAFQEAIAFASSGAVSFPSDELLWLASFSWNAGVKNGANKAWAERWMAKALGLLPACPQLHAKEKQMRAAYDRILLSR
jgi:hypothetical protein